MPIVIGIFCPKSVLDTAISLALGIVVSSTLPLALALLNDVVDKPDETEIVFLPSELCSTVNSSSWINFQPPGLIQNDWYIQDWLLLLLSLSHFMFVAALPPKLALGLPFATPM